VTPPRAAGPKKIDKKHPQNQKQTKSCEKKEAGEKNGVPKRLQRKGQMREANERSRPAGGTVERGHGTAFALAQNGKNRLKKRHAPERIKGMRKRKENLQREKNAP